MSTARDLHDLLVDELQEIYWSEKALTKAFAKLMKVASSKELVDVFQNHLIETEEQLMRLEEVFESIGEKVTSKKCEAMDGLIEEAESMIDATKEGIVRDAGIILSAQKIEHYEIASYGTMCAFAKTLDETEALDLLQTTLEEEKTADYKLSKIAESFVNVQASHMGNGHF